MEHFCDYVMNDLLVHIIILNQNNLGSYYVKCFEKLLFKELYKIHYYYFDCIFYQSV